MDNRVNPDQTRRTGVRYMAIKDWYQKLLGFIGSGAVAGIAIPNKSLSFNATPLPTTTFTNQYFYPFFNNAWNIPAMEPYAANVLGDFFGQPLGNQLIEGFLIVNIVGIIWARQDDAAIPLFLLWIFGLILFAVPGFMPAGWENFILLLEALTMGGVAYTLYRGRRNS